MNLKLSRLTLIKLFFWFSTICYSSFALSEEANNNRNTTFKPFILAQTVASTDTKLISLNVERRLKKARFEIVGRYSPYENTQILVISNPKLRKIASLSENGIYAAVQRVTITTTNNSTQVAFSNPTYTAHAYRLKSDLADITRRLKKTLGFTKEYGAKEGLTRYRLRHYQYRWMMMPNFTDRLELAEYSNQKVALKHVLNALNNNTAGVSKVYQVSLKSKNQTIIGIQMKGNASNNCSSDSFIMQQIDSKQLKSTGHLPYELIIKDGEVSALFAEFRIAMNFPDLSMMGKNSFGSIMCAPDAIFEALTVAAGGDPEESW